MPLGRVVHWRDPDWHVIQIDDAMLPAIAGIDACSHLIIVYQTVVREGLERNAANVSFGVCATRFRERPSGLGVSVVEYLRLDDELLYVRGLHALVGDAVLDVQPYIGSTDAVQNTVRPPWPVFDTERS
jgi:tRNA (Thr-GGU) A37 N-methylase